MDGVTLTGSVKMNKNLFSVCHFDLPSDMYELTASLAGLEPYFPNQGKRRNKSFLNQKLIAAFQTNNHAKIGAITYFCQNNHPRLYIKATFSNEINALYFGISFEEHATLNQKRVRIEVPLIPLWINNPTIEPPQVAIDKVKASLADKRHLASLFYQDQTTNYSRHCAPNQYAARV